MLNGLRTCIWFFWLAFKHKFYATGSSYKSTLIKMSLFFTSWPHVQPGSQVTQPHFPLYWPVKRSAISNLCEWFSCRSTTPKIADIFLTKGHFLKLYSTYILDFERITAAFDDACSKNPAFSQVVKEFEVREGACLGSSTDKPPLVTRSLGPPKHAHYWEIFVIL